MVDEERPREGVLISGAFCFYQWMCHHRLHLHIVTLLEGTAVDY